MLWPNPLFLSSRLQLRIAREEVIVHMFLLYVPPNDSVHATADVFKNDSSNRLAGHREIPRALDKLSHRFLTPLDNYFKVTSILVFIERYTFSLLFH